MNLFLGDLHAGLRSAIFLVEYLPRFLRHMTRACEWLREENICFNTHDRAAHLCLASSLKMLVAGERGWLATPTLPYELAMQMANLIR